MSIATPGLGGELLERDETIAVLGGLLASVRADRVGRLVWLGGEAGVGKTALLRRFCGRQEKALRMLWGSCEPLRTPRPLGPLVDVAEAVGGDLADMVAISSRPYEFASALLGELRLRGPTVLVLEDLHWADEATLDVITLLATRISSAPALVLASYRDDELNLAPGLRLVLGEVARHPGRLKIEPLSQAAVAALAEPHGLDASELYVLTGGNPFFVTEVLAAGGRRMPETVRDAVLARAARLSEPARRLIEAVAIVPGQLELWLLNVLAGRFVDRLEECLSSGMLTAGASTLAFRHELARRAIEEAIPPDRRLVLERAALGALDSHGGGAADFARLAYHADCAGDAEAVLKWAPLAAEWAAAAGAHREAADQYDRAIRFADREPPNRRAELLQRRADECFTTDQFAPAIEAQEAALELRRRAGDDLGEGDALRSLSKMLRYVGRTQEAQTAALAAVGILEPLVPGRELALAYCNASYVSLSMEDADRAATWASRAVELAQRVHDADALVYALTNLAVVDFRAGGPHGQLKLERALELAQQHGLEDHIGRAFANLVVWPMRHRMLTVAATYLEAGLGYCAERGLDTWRLYLLALRVRLELDLGRWDEAANSATLVLRDPRSAPVPRGWALAALGLLRARRGDPDASAPLQEARSLAHGTGELQRIAPAAAATAEHAWLNGDHAAVKQATDAVLSLALDRKAPWVVGELAYWRWAAGVRDELAPELVAEPYRLSIAGDWARAADRWREIGCPYESALGLADSDDGVALRQAVEQLQSLGARPAAALVARRLRERGLPGVPRGPRRSTRENPAGLTAREVEVLALLAEGLRNAQIATRLVVSEKTVDHHVSAILRKLGVHTRAQAAAEAARLSLIAPK